MRGPAIGAVRSFEEVPAQGDRGKPCPASVALLAIRLAMVGAAAGKQMVAWHV